MPRQRALPAGKLDVSDAVDALRYKIARADAFASTADEQLDDAINDPCRRERLSYIIEAAAIATREALEACQRLVDELAKARG